MKKIRNILFLTGADKSKLLIKLLESGYPISALVLPRSDKYQKHYQPMLEVAKDKALKLIITDPKELHQSTQDLDFDVLISSGYPFMIPVEVFSRASIALNFHPTLLPKYRGRYLHPILINRDQETGVTAHLIDEAYDTGPIVQQIKYPVSTFDSIKSLSRKNINAEIQLALEVLESITRGELKAQTQDEKLSSSYFKPRTPEDSEINPDKSLRDLFYEIRCCDPELYPAFFYLDGQKVYLKVFRKDKAEDEFDMI